MSLKQPRARVAKAGAVEVVKLCAQLAPRRRPLYLDWEPTEGALVSDCFENVARAVKAHGGSALDGWLIWETLPGVMIEAEFHAVWEDGLGGYHDITPKALPGHDRVLFLPDDTRAYAGRQVDNMRVALKDHPLVHKFIQAAKQDFNARNAGDLADYRGDALPPTPEIMAAERGLAAAHERVMEKFYS